MKKIAIFMVVLLMLLATSAQAALVGEWHLDEGSGTIANDSSVNGNHGTIYGASYVAGKCDQALSFNGSGDYVVVANDSSQQMTENQITVAAWIMLNADVGNTQRRIVSKQETNGICWGLELFGAGYGGSSGNQINFHDSSGSTWRNCLSTTDLNVNQWYHVAVTDNAGEITIYIDGAPDHTCTGYGIPASISSPIYIGTYSPSRFFFNGVIDEVRIYNNALTAEQIEDLLNCGVIEVEIDIKPGSYPNSINLKSKGVVPVAVLTTGDFDASTVDPDTVEFAGAEPVRWALEDVDDDSDLDLLLHFKTQDLDLTEDSTEATLTGETLDGVQIEGTDTVNIVPPAKAKPNKK